MKGGCSFCKKCLPSRYQRYNVCQSLECDCENYLLRIIARNLRYRDACSPRGSYPLFAKSAYSQKGFEGNTYEFLTAPQPKGRSLMDEMRKKGRAIAAPAFSLRNLHSRSTSQKTSSSHKLPVQSNPEPRRSMVPSPGSATRVTII